MKRQRSNTEGATMEGGKKIKNAVEGNEMDGKNKNNGGEVAVENWCGWEERAWWLRGGAMDELMPWGCFWSPFWGVDYVDFAYTEIFSDVAWDDDIWNLKTIVEIPKP
ncbi:hypothetical protein CXB51_004184 [Gossypium anomalum]|uniref:Uncharacterized protein n=1 Tax=Gossypium anomalum TaxID=47600 RepID=A0A8J5Z4Q8_9ROSI|nr:hypothetical protein CXB51_004184 [Gossypium anomalum]